MGSIQQRLLPSIAPALLIAIGYVDPGKWVAAVEGGARFGFDLGVLLLVFNFAAILCQYLSCHIGVVTGRDLVQICHDEYDKSTCMFLGVQAALSVIAFDVTMILGIAHGLNLVFGADLLTCLSLSTVDVILFPLFAPFLENWTGRFLQIIMAGFIMLSYVFGVLVSQPEIPFSVNGMLTKLSGESSFALMSLLGASISPHNFYVHSYFVKHQGLPNASKGALCYDHFFAILCVFSGVFLVNYVLMNSAANVFHSTGLFFVTFHDVLSLLDQVLRSPIARFGFLLVLFFSNQIIASTWNPVGRIILHDFFKLDIPGGLPRATIRIIAILPALHCTWTSGAEGIYQLLLFTQVMVALLLPSSVIPLFRVASSRSIMGAYKISPFMEFLSLITFIGMLGLKVIFVVEMIFGNSDWVGILRCNISSSTSGAYIVLLILACASSCLMLWLLATPLKSASFRIVSQARNGDIQNLEPNVEREVNDFHDSYLDQEPGQQQEPSTRLEKSMPSYSNVSFPNVNVDLPETILDQEPLLTAIEENLSDGTFSASPPCHPEELPVTAEPVHSPTIIKEISNSELLNNSSFNSELSDPLEKIVGIERDLQILKDDEEGDNWEPEETSKSISGISPSLPSDGPGSFRSSSGKSDDGGNGPGSLSRLAGLGRAARRQLAAVLDEFWGQFYDLHGQATQDAKSKRLDIMLGADSKPALKVDTSFPSLGGRGSDSLANSGLFDSPRLQTVQSTVESSYGVQRGTSSLWSNRAQLLDAYVQNSSRNAFNLDERRYPSLRLPLSSDGWDYQPATIHGYPMASYLNRAAKDSTSDYLTCQRGSRLSGPIFSGPTNSRGSLTFSLGQNLQNGPNWVQTSGFQNATISRNSSMQSERYSDIYSSGPALSVVGPANSKKYHSLPDISGLSVPHRDSYISDRSMQCETPIGFGSSAGRTTCEQSPYSSAGLRGGTSLAFDELSSSKAFQNAFSLQLSSSPDTESLWSRQPFEQLGLANKYRGMGAEGLGCHPSAIAEVSTSPVDLEVKLLQSCRYCIVRLLKLEGSDWLFRQNDGLDEELIDRVAARERLLHEVETGELNQVAHMEGSLYVSSDKRSSSALKNDDSGFNKFLVSSIPHCGEGCIWKADLVISFGVWCIHRILELSLMESRPELWGKYTYVLNRLQGIIDLAFPRPRSPRPPCFCIQIPAALQQKSSPPLSNGILPLAVKPGRGKCTTASTLLDIVKDVEIAISCRRGRQGTAAGDVAFPKGKENLASVLKRYKRRLSSKQVGTNEGANPARKVST